MFIRLEINGSNPESSILTWPFMFYVRAANKLFVTYCNVRGWNRHPL
jgi:hypothetical protein